MNHILTTAKQRAQDQSLPYAGAVTPLEAWNLLQADTNIMLVDVRTNAERDWVGRVIINDAQHHAVQWMLYPESIPNPDFMAQLSALISDKDTIILFLCRSGVRSCYGAKLATEHGYTQCFDILEGFEGNKDAHGHRKTVGGWCHSNLAWQGA